MASIVYGVEEFCRSVGGKIINVNKQEVICNIDMADTKISIHGYEGVKMGNITVKADREETTFFEDRTNVKFCEVYPDDAFITLECNPSSYSTEGIKVKISEPKNIVEIIGSKQHRFYVIT